MSALVIARACTGSEVKVATGRWAGASGVSRLYRLGAFRPLCASSIPANAPPSWIASAMRARAGRSCSSQIRSSMNGAISEVGWISTCSVHTTAQPPSAFTLRMAASALGSR
jgi:hypothetical protein